MRKIDLTDFQLATSETARDINRRILLNLIRTRQPISRADLARFSGLQRCTVSLITEQLLKENWISEGALGRLPRGRRPTFLHLNLGKAGIIGINVRPSGTTIGLGDFCGNITVTRNIPTDNDPGLFVEKLGRIVNEFVAEHPEAPFEGIGVSLPGRVQKETNRLVFAPNLGWRNIDFKTPLEKVTGLPVELENACNACALAETWFGKHQDVRDLVAVTVSEGVGAGIIFNGQLVRGPSDMAGEFGHVAIAEEGPLCRCGNTACWEAFASNTAGVRYYSEATAPKHKTRHAAPISFQELLNLALKNDSAAVSALRKQGHYLGVGIAMLVTGLAPRVIVIVGEVTRAWSIVGPEIDKVLAKRCLPIIKTKVVPSDETGHPRLQGTLAVIMQKHFGAPDVA